MVGGWVWALLALFAAWTGIGGLVVASLLRWPRTSACPRERCGYRCHRDRAGGCEQECGRSDDRVNERVTEASPTAAPRPRAPLTAPACARPETTAQHDSSAEQVCGFRCVFDDDGRYRLPPCVVLVVDVRDAALLIDVVAHVRAHTGRSTTVQVSVCAEQLLGWALVDPDAAPVWFSLTELRGEDIAAVMAW